MAKLYESKRVTRKLQFFFFNAVFFFCSSTHEFVSFKLKQLHKQNPPLPHDLSRGDAISSFSFSVSMHQLALSEQWEMRCTIREEQLCVCLRERIHRETL